MLPNMTYFFTKGKAILPAFLVLDGQIGTTLEIRFIYDDKMNKNYLIILISRAFHIFQQTLKSYVMRLNLSDWPRHN